MASLSERLAVSYGAVEPIGALQGHSLPEPSELYRQAFERAPQSPDEAQLLLASAILSNARRTSEGRLAAAQTLLAPLVANANPMKTLGPDGAALRADMMPLGWQQTVESWPRLRYAWREGMIEMLDVKESMQHSALALDELTRFHPGEPEPTAVQIKEQAPWEPLASLLGIIGTLLAVRAFVKDIRKNKRR